VKLPGDELRQLRDSLLHQRLQIERRIVLMEGPILPEDKVLHRQLDHIWAQIDELDRLTGPELVGDIIAREFPALVGCTDREIP
jgi:hypothetical protein